MILAFDDDYATQATKLVPLRGGAEILAATLDPGPSAVRWAASLSDVDFDAYEVQTTKLVPLQRRRPTARQRPVSRARHVAPRRVRRAARATRRAHRVAVRRLARAGPAEDGPAPRCSLELAATNLAIGGAP